MKTLSFLFLSSFLSASQANYIRHQEAPGEEMARPDVHRRLQCSDAVINTAIAAALSSINSDLQGAFNDPYTIGFGVDITTTATLTGGTCDTETATELSPPTTITGLSTGEFTTLSVTGATCDLSCGTITFGGDFSFEWAGSEIVVSGPTALTTGTGTCTATVDPTTATATNLKLAGVMELSGEISTDDQVTIDSADIVSTEVTCESMVISGSVSTSDFDSDKSGIYSSLATEVKSFLNGSLFKAVFEIIVKGAIVDSSSSFTDGVVAYLGSLGSRVNSWLGW